MKGIEIEAMFNGLVFQRMGEEIRTKAAARIEAIKAKIEDRRARVMRICKENEISDADMVELLQQALHAANQRMQMQFYTIKSGGGLLEDRSIAVGVVNNIAAEKEAIADEQDQLARLGLIVRNIEGQSMHKLSFKELDYLGF